MCLSQVEDGSYMDHLFDAAATAGLSVALHVEPYEGRTATTLRKDLQFVADTYLHKKPALQMWEGRPVYYLYDQYRLSASEWATLFVRSHTPPPAGNKYHSECTRNITERGGV